MKRDIVIRALGSSGSTWISLILASHKDRSYIGPPDRLWNLVQEDSENACLNHTEQCLLNTFVSNSDRSKPFLQELEGYVGKKNWVIFNPSPNFESKELSDVEVVNIVLLRDIRAVAWSLMRHQPERFKTAVDVIQQVLVHKFGVIESFINQPNSIMVRYEDFVENPIAQLGRISDVCGSTYSKDSLSFWNFQHHMSAGNTGSIDVLRRMQGEVGFEFARKAFYDETLEYLRKDPETPIIDHSWKDSLSPDDLLALKAVFGETFSGLGYDFSSEESDNDLKVLRDSILKDLKEFENRNPYWGQSR